MTERAKKETVSTALVSRVAGNHRWREDVKMTGDIFQLRDAVAREAQANGWRVVGFVPTQYGATAR